MTYSNEPDNTMEQELAQPVWLKVLRYLVFGLMIASIIAMLSVAWAAFNIVGKTTLTLPPKFNLADGEHPISITTQANGNTIVVHDGVHLGATLFDPSGDPISKAVFE